MAIKACAAVAVLISCCILPGCDAHLPRIAPRKVFNVLSYGAIPGNRYDNAPAFVKAWRAACDYNGTSAKLLIPPGLFMLSETLFTGPCLGRHPITVIISATLHPVADITNFPEYGWIAFQRIDGLILRGRGTIDGQGQKLWHLNDCKTNPRCVRLPATLYVSHVQNAKIKGLKLLNSMGFHMHVTLCDRVRLSGLHITAPDDSPNTDGMHISKSNFITVVRTVIGTGDDCISIGHGSNNIAAKKVTCGPGHGFSLGSLGKMPDEWDVNGIIVSNCTLRNTTNGVRIKTYPASAPSIAANVVFKDIILEHVKNPIIIDQHYGNKKSEPSRVQIKDVVYQNIRGTSITPEAVNLNCSSIVPCSNVRLENIDVHHEGVEKTSSVCEFAKVSYVGRQFPPRC